MKYIVSLFASIALFITHPLHAQLIESQNFPFAAFGYVTFNITLTATGPVNILVNTTGVLGKLEIDGANLINGNAPHIGGELSVVNYTSAPLSPGPHTIVIGQGGYGGATLIAPNEPASGIQNAIATLNSGISSLQQAEQSDASNIATLKVTQGSQASQIIALQTAEANDASLITGLQAQLLAMQTTLQAEIAQDEANIANLQNGQTSQTGQITTLQNQVAQLQPQVTQLQAALAAIPAPTAAPSYTSQFENLQNQIHSLKSTNQNQWMTIGAVGLLGATGTAISAFELSQGGNNSLSSNGTSHPKLGSSNPYSSTVSPYIKKN